MKPTQAILRQRLDEVLAIRLDGATFHDVRRYVAEKEVAGEQPWLTPDGGKPVSERTVWRYIEQTDKMIAEDCRVSRKRRWRLHLKRREKLYAEAKAQGDTRAAGAILRDLAELENLYPAKKTELTGKKGGPVVLKIREIIAGREPGAALPKIREEVVTSDGNKRGVDDPPPSGTESVPAI